MAITNQPLKVKNNLAEDCSIAGVFDELDQDFINLIRENKLNPKPLLICGGGTSSRCASDGLWSLDLRRKYNQINIDLLNEEVEIGAGVKMATLINELSTTGNSFPIGLSGETGLGYILSGGISPISRNQGLAIDQLIKIRGFWGSGESFDISKPNAYSSLEERRAWRGLNGAAPFLAIITHLTLRIQKINPLYIYQSVLTPDQLAESIYQAEYWPNPASLQWIWGDEIKAYAVIELDKSKEAKEAKNLLKDLPFYKEASSSIVEGIKDMPKFVLPIKNNNSFERQHSEVIGLLGEDWGRQASALIKSINELMDNRPNRNCYIAAQQLGGITKSRDTKESSFIYKDASWKPWICGSWNKADLICKKNSLNWIEKLWEEMQPLCPGIHLAQMHQHLPWHQKEIKKAFKDWLPELQNLKLRYDPNGILPPL